MDPMMAGSLHFLAGRLNWWKESLTDAGKEVVAKESA
jgi:hypothetical protein